MSKSSSNTLPVPLISAILQPAQHLEEEYPDVASYLTSLASPQTENSTSTSTTHTAPRTLSAGATSEYHAAREAEGLTDTLLSSVDEVMMRAEAEGTDPDPELRALVEQAIVQGMLIGNGWADQQRERVVEESAVGADGVANKRRRMDEDGRGPSGST